MITKGKQFGVKLIERFNDGFNDGHCIIQVISEDDEHWADEGSSFSSAWLDD
jgi:hypothetical protein